MFIKGYADVYSVKVMCQLLEVPRSTYYYTIKSKPVKENKSNELDERLKKYSKQITVFMVLGK
jgi:hypothetical protein